MKVAVDVLGTLQGPKRSQIYAMLRALHEAGHHITVWSSEFSMAVNEADILHEQGIDCDVSKKQEKFCTSEEFYFDYAIEDDRRQTYLAARKFIWVDEIPVDTVDALTLVRNLK